MLHRVLLIGRWVVDFLFAPRGYDIEGVLACLYEIGAPSRIIDRAREIMENEELNRGFTFSNQEIRRAVVVVGPSSSGEQFVNTTAHELYHLSVAIASSLGVDLEGENPAYIIGDTMQSLIEVICELGCSKCN